VVTRSVCHVTSLCDDRVNHRHIKTLIKADPSDLFFYLVCGLCGGVVSSSATT